MKKRIVMTQREGMVTDRDFYNLFRPIIPTLDIIGKTAQVISALTEAITIWFIIQSVLSHINKWLAVVVSLIAMTLVITLLELGGRKFLQVLTRTVVWKKFENIWYKSLLLIIAVITLGLGYISFNLSTSGVRYIFETSSAKTVPTTEHEQYVDSAHTYRMKETKARFEKRQKMATDNHKQLKKAAADKYDSRINKADLQIAWYQKQLNTGKKWAIGHIDKHKKQIADLKIDKATALAELDKKYSTESKSLAMKQEAAIEAHKKEHQSILQKRASILAAIMN